MKNILQGLLMSNQYTGRPFSTEALKGVLYEDKLLELNYFLQVADFVNKIYEKYPKAHFRDYRDDISSCLSKNPDDTSLPVSDILTDEIRDKVAKSVHLIVDYNYNIINHSCLTDVARRMYTDLPNLQSYEVYENPIQLALVPENRLGQFLILTLAFFALIVLIFH